ncbi:putative transcription initiation factor iif subunit alpha [Erysiphe necator]|uniref:Putative transcription initiation factor iif subunit alpha n=1 Tax=Uncinula necator TaxID=52586 RepID=A0A0B1P6N9_UNCNE|nr:putative transcription initiation factor iif subunit alpha [Erysiphe necator]
MNAGGLTQMASFNNFSSSTEFGVPTSGFTSRRGSTIKSLSFDKSKISGLPENSTPTPRTSRSHLLAGLRTAPKNSNGSGPLTAPPYLQNDSNNNLRYATNNMNHYDPSTYSRVDQQNICGSQFYTMPEDILAPPEIHIDEASCEQMDANYYAQLIATNRYLAEQQQRLQQQLRNVQVAAQQFQGMNLGLQQCSTPPITPQSLYQQQLKYNLQTIANPFGNMLPIYPSYNIINGNPAHLQSNQQAGQLENLQSAQNFANHTSAQKTPAHTHVRNFTLLPESNTQTLGASSPGKSNSPTYDHTPLPPPSAGAFRRGHRKAPSSLAVYSENGSYLDTSKTSTTPKSSAISYMSSGFGPGQARIGEHPIRQPRGPPSIEVLLAKPNTTYEGAKNFATRTRRSAVGNLVRAGIERRRVPGSTGSGSISPASDAGDVTFSVTDNDSDSGRSGGGSLSSRPTLGSPRTSIHGAIGSNRPSSRQNSRFMERKSIASLNSSYTSTSVSGDECSSLGGNFAVVVKNGRKGYSDENEKKAPMLVLTPAEKHKNLF